MFKFIVLVSLSLFISACSQSNRNFEKQKSYLASKMKSPFRIDMTKLTSSASSETIEAKVSVKDNSYVESIEIRWLGKNNQNQYIELSKKRAKFIDGEHKEIMEVSTLYKKVVLIISNTTSGQKNLTQTQVYHLGLQDQINKAKKALSTSY